jgi:TatD DNase family protein
VAELPWFDTHVHLDRYDLAERAAVLERARAANVSVIAVGVDLKSSREVSAMGDVCGRVVGIHPRYAAADFEEELREIALCPGVLGIGECGFDDSGVDWKTQERAFRTQCGIARDLGLTLVLHIDGEQAWGHLIAAGLEGLRVIRHYFTGDATQAAWHGEREHYLSFGNPLLREPSLREIARDYPEHLLLIETDSYPLPGRNTEPAHVAKVGETLALLRGWTVEEARKHLAQNTRAAFGLTTAL